MKDFYTQWKKEEQMPFSGWDFSYLKDRKTEELPPWDYISLAKELIKKWVNFFFDYNCGKCVPCREGLYRLREMLQKNEIDMVLLRSVLRAMRDTSFCPLGKSVYLPIDSMLESVKVNYKNKRDSK